MARVRTISVSLEPAYVEILEELSRRLGSRSAALRYLLAEFRKEKEAREIEAAYRDYFRQEGAAARERALTDEMLGGARWPGDPPARRGNRAGTKRRDLSS